MNISNPFRSIPVQTQFQTNIFTSWMLVYPPFRGSSNSAIGIVPFYNHLQLRCLSILQLHHHLFRSASGFLRNLSKFWANLANPVSCQVLSSFKSRNLLGLHFLEITHF